MLVYKATEKDCIGEDGTEIECIICLEEFEVGDEMSRLECLCKFHKVSYTRCTSYFTLCLLTWLASRNALESGGRRKVRGHVQLINYMISNGALRGQYLAATSEQHLRQTSTWLSIAISISTRIINKASFRIPTT
jgi:hypothetical protein